MKTFNYNLIWLLKYSFFWQACVVTSTHCTHAQTLKADTRRVGEAIGSKKRESTAPRRLSLRIIFKASGENYNPRNAKHQEDFYFHLLWENILIFNQPLRCSILFIIYALKILLFCVFEQVKAMSQAVCLDRHTYIVDIACAIMSCQY